ncbi:hypothetical protein ACOMHN_017053 [Nucella lapillus]
MEVDLKFLAGDLNPTTTNTTPHLPSSLHPWTENTNSHPHQHDLHDLQGQNLSQGGGFMNDTFVWVKQPMYMVVVLSLSYGLVLVVAVLGNLCVVGVVYRDKHFHTPTYVFIVNLAVADLAVAVFCLPVTLLTNIYNESQSFRH